MTRAATIRRQCPPTGNWITGPAHLFATDTIGKPFVKPHMTGHRHYIDPVPFTRGKLK